MAAVVVLDLDCSISSVYHRTQHTTHLAVNTLSQDGPTHTHTHPSNHRDSDAIAFNNPNKPHFGICYSSDQTQAKVHVSVKLLLLTELQMDRRTDKRTDGQTDIVAHSLQCHEIRNESYGWLCPYAGISLSSSTLGVLFCIASAHGVVHAHFGR